MESISQHRTVPTIEVPHFTVYTVSVSNFGTAVRLGLTMKGLDFETIAPPGGYGSAEYKQIIPSGTSPGIIMRTQLDTNASSDDEPFRLSESHTILEFIEEYCPRLPVQSLLYHEQEWGVQATARKNASVRFVHRLHDLYVEPPLRALFSHMDPKVRNNEFVQEKFELFYKRLQDLEIARAGAYKKYLQEANASPQHERSDVEQLPSQFGPFFFGSQCTFADCVLAPTFQMAEVMSRELLGESLSYQTAPLVGQWRRDVVTEPRLQPLLKEQLEATEAWVLKKRGET